MSTRRSGSVIVNEAERKAKFADLERSSWIEAGTGRAVRPYKSFGQLLGVFCSLLLAFFVHRKPLFALRAYVSAVCMQSIVCYFGGGELK